MNKDHIIAILLFCLIGLSVAYILRYEKYRILQSNFYIEQKEKNSAIDMRHFMYNKLNRLEECMKSYDKKSAEYRADVPVTPYCTVFDLAEVEGN